MSDDIAFETRGDFMHHQGSYPAMDDHQGQSPDQDQFPDQSDAVAELANIATYTGPAGASYADADHRLDLGSPTPLPKNDTPSLNGTQQRVKAIPKPERELTKNEKGVLICTWPGCQETKEFSRKCEWNKHMDKHDRPYKCSDPGCEKLPGFTYSGGLLRHEREVHNKHGGPKTSYNCPHPTCKRHTGKGFSRAENLAEHMRRVHTNAGDAASDDGSSNNGAGAANANGNNTKRKRDDDDSEQEFKRLKHENQDLRRQLDHMNRQTAKLIEQVNTLQAALSGGLPMTLGSNAPML